MKEFEKWWEDHSNCHYGAKGTAAGTWKAALEWVLSSTGHYPHERDRDYAALTCDIEKELSDK